MEHSSLQEDTDSVLAQINSVLRTPSTSGRTFMGSSRTGPIPSQSESFFVPPSSEYQFNALTASMLDTTERQPLRPQARPRQETNDRVITQLDAIIAKIDEISQIKLPDIDMTLLDKQ